jgi:diguanylate cyclase (GGDEF)-like protein/PAS domain S-box-containing protein
MPKDSSSPDALTAGSPGGRFAGPAASAKMESVFRSLREGMVVTDADARIVWVNRAACEISGYGEHELLGATPAIFSSGRQSRRFYDEMWQTIVRQGWWAGEIWNRRKDGEIYPQWLSIAAVYDAEGRIENYVSMFSDISARKQSEEQMMRLAHYDALTGLPNRTLFFDRLQQGLALARRHNSRLSLFVVDLDHFKSVNDNFGHTHGDQVLAQAAQRLLSCLRQSDSVARVGADEFAVILNFVGGEAEIAEVARKIIAAMDIPFRVGAHTHHLGCSIGVAIYPEDGDDTETLLRHADAAMYLAKHAGRGTYRQVSRDRRLEMEREAQLNSRMHEALAAGQFFLMYQPQVEAASGRLVGLEALIRWRLPDGTLVPPGQFIPLAERTGFVAAIDRHVMELGARQMASWARAGLELVPVSFNVSAGEFMQAGVEKEVVSLFRGKGVDPRLVVMEVTETAAMSDLTQTMQILESWRALGIGVAIDDFGTGFSSLNYLRKFPANSLKIDQSFIRALDESPGDRALVESIIELAQKLNLEVVAEGVELRSQYDFLRQRGCDVVQGYLFSPPILADEATLLLQRREVPLAPPA